MIWTNPNSFEFNYFLPKCATPAKVAVDVFYREESDTFLVVIDRIWFEHEDKTWLLTPIVSQEVLNTIDKEAQSLFANFLNTGANK